MWKKNYSFQVTDLRFKVDNITPKEIQLLEKYRGATDNPRLNLLLFSYRESKMISDGKKTKNTVF